jgi:hypothetical protein
MARAIWSAAPPGGKLTMTRTGLFGQLAVCENAGSEVETAIQNIAATACQTGKLGTFDWNLEGIFMNFILAEN